MAAAEFLANEKEESIRSDGEVFAGPGEWGRGEYV
jgi:hypothetical protein